MSTPRVYPTLVALLTLIACGGDDPTSPGVPAPPTVATVSVSPSVTTLGEIGATSQLQANHQLRPFNLARAGRGTCAAIGCDARQSSVPHPHAPAD